MDFFKVSTNRKYITIDRNRMHMHIMYVANKQICKKTFLIVEIAYLIFSSLLFLLIFSLLFLITSRKLCRPTSFSQMNNMDGDKLNSKGSN